VLRVHGNLQLVTGLVQLGAQRQCLLVQVVVPPLQPPCSADPPRAEEQEQDGVCDGVWQVGVFYTIAAIEAAVALLLGPSILLDAGLFAGLGIWLHRTNSRVAATLLLILAGISIVTTASNQFGGGQGGRNIVLAVIVFWIAIRAVFATYKLPALTREEALADVAG